MVKNENITKFYFVIIVSISVIIIYYFNVVRSQNRRCTDIFSAENVLLKDENMPTLADTSKTLGIYPNTEILSPPGMAK